ncbi:hypothetical protein ACHAXR_002801, partial [Thalassiosira sp. AJA248-18]
MAKDKGAPAIPPGTEALFSVTCKDVVMGRGSGTQNHCGNVTYRKLVYLNKELYATSSKFDKLKISKAIVAAVRDSNGHFVQADDKRGGLYYDIGDKRAWDKTSQALREGQAEIRARLAEEDPAGMSKVAEYKQVISEQKFFAYACKMLDMLYHPENGDSGISACGLECPHAKRRHTLNQLGADPMRIHTVLQSISPPMSQLQQSSQLPQQQAYMQQTQPYNSSMAPGGGFQGSDISIEPLPLDAPAPVGVIGSISAYVAEHLNKVMTPGGSIATETTAPTYTSHPTSLPTKENGDYIEPLPYQNETDALQRQGLQRQGLQRPGLGTERLSSGKVFSLRQFCSEDFEITSEEGKILMDQLNEEVDDIIRQKSYGLIKIDTTDAFEDLVFEEDSMDFDDPQDTFPRKTRASNSSSKNSRNSSASARISGLSYKDDMSLMNMSILTLDEKEESEKPRSRVEGSYSSSTPKSIIKQQDPSEPRNTKKRESRVSFAGRKSNMSLMSMDNESFSQLVDCIKDPEGDSIERMMSGSSNASNDSHSVSRKMGFPMRPKVAKQYGVQVPPIEVGHKVGGRS